MSLSALLNNRHVELTLASSSTIRFSPQRLQMILVLPVVERPPLGGAWFSRASRNGSHPTYTSTVVCEFFFFLMYFWAFWLYPSPHVHPYFYIWILVTQYTYQITFNSDSGFVAFMPQAKGPASSETLSSRSYVLRFIFGLPSPTVFFISCYNWFSCIYKK
jgi:hypothetical protein